MGRKPSTKPTSFDIAYLAGVSQPTVSRALRGSRAVSQATRERIEAIARELHYTVDKNASSLRSQRSNTIALLFFEDPTPDESMINLPSSWPCWARSPDNAPIAGWIC